ncbi:divergent PAP2 family protein [Candidatus Margulisiibacteriota bacterium]
MNDYLNIYYKTYPLISALTSMFIAQGSKIIQALIIDKKWKPNKMISSGGMPSSHAATVTALTISIGLSEGWFSPIFYVAAIFSLIVLYDAVGVRRAVGQQGEILNQIMTDDPKVQIKASGHSPLEVIIGILLGAAIAIILRLLQ